MMPTCVGDELLGLSERLSTVASRADDSAFTAPLNSQMDAAEEVGRSWSNSNIGFHADVYYEGLQSPPPGAHFSPEWGLLGTFQGTAGNWKEYPRDVIVQHIDAKAGNQEVIGSTPVPGSDQMQGFCARYQAERPLSESLDLSR